MANDARRLALEIATPVGRKTVYACCEQCGALALCRARAHTLVLVVQTRGFFCDGCETVFRTPVRTVQRITCALCELNYCTRCMRDAPP